MTKMTRAGSRTHLRFPATLTMQDESRHSALTVDLSHGGVCLQMDARIRLAQYCAVSFKVPAADGALQPVLAMGQVIYSDPEPGRGYKTGVQFLQLDGPSVSAIAELLQSER